MNSEPAPVPAPARRSTVFRNWLSLTGLVVVIGSLFSFFFLLLLDALAHFSNPYVGILTYLVASLAAEADRLGKVIGLV